MFYENILLKKYYNCYYKIYEIDNLNYKYVQSSYKYISFDYINYLCIDEKIYN